MTSSGVCDAVKPQPALYTYEVNNELTTTCVSPVVSVYVAAGGVQLWGGVSAVIQHVIRQVCEQFLQLQGKKNMEMSHRGCSATKL